MAAERARIARELHDVVAHSISVMVVQAGAARRVLDARPGRGRASALGAIEATGREALAEMRRLLGVLRRGDEDALARARSRRSRRSSALVEQRARRRPAGRAARSRASRATLPAGRRPVGLPDRAGGADQRAQARRPGARARVRSATSRTTLELEVDDDGAAGAAADGAGGGHGLVGMRERVALFGGELEAGPRAGRRLRACGPRLPARAEVHA